MTEMHNDKHTETSDILIEADHIVTAINMMLADQERLFALHNITQEDFQMYLNRIKGSKLERETREKLLALKRANEAGMQLLLVERAPNKTLLKRPRGLRKMA